jgi:carbonic anhydrase
MKKFKAMVLSCMDPRFQPKIFNYLKKRKLNGEYSSFTIAGSAVGVTHIRFKMWHKTFFENLAVSIKIHRISKLIVINHEDCRAARVAEGKEDIDEVKIHKISFEKLKKKLNKKFPKLKLEFHIMKLNSKLVKLQLLLISNQWINFGAEIL